MLLSVDATILAVDNLESLDQRISRGPFLHVSPSPNGKFLALLTFSGILWVVSADFQREIVVLDTATVGAEGSVSQVGWCGNDAVLVTWNDLVLLVLPSRSDPAGETLRFVTLSYVCSGDIDSEDMKSYLYFGATFVVTESDGARVIGQDVCDFIQKVPGKFTRVLLSTSES